MELDFSKLFHLSSKNHAKGHTPIPKNSADWPDEWKTIFYKSYPRLPKISLPRSAPQKNFFSIAQTRQSRRNFTRHPLSLEELSVLLQYSCGERTHENTQGRRVHPSGGGRYPVEIYPIVFREGSDLAAGLYHYNVPQHSLDVVWPRDFLDEEILQFFSYEFAKETHMVIVMTATFWRAQTKYGERGYRYILLEAGHIGQNLFLAAEALGLKCCPIGTRDEQLEKLIDIDGVTESVIYALALGK